MFYLETFFIIAVSFCYTAEFQLKKTVFFLSTQQHLLYTPPQKGNPVRAI